MKDDFSKDFKVRLSYSNRLSWEQKTYYDINITKSLTGYFESVLHMVDHS